MGKRLGLTCVLALIFWGCDPGDSPLSTGSVKSATTLSQLEHLDAPTRDLGEVRATPGSYVVLALGVAPTDGTAEETPQTPPADEQAEKGEVPSDRSATPPSDAPAPADETTTPVEEEDATDAPAPPAYEPLCNDHDRHGLPSASDVLLCRTDYLVGYNIARKTADWVSYHVTKEGAEMVIERTDDFRPDEEITESAQAVLSDYKGSGFDRGHMFPAALATSDAAMSESFLLTNITPQLPGFNRYGWKDLEAWARGCASKVGEIDVVTGTVYDEDLTFIGDAVQIPDAFYKVVHHKGVVQAFLVSHAKADMDDVAYWEIAEADLEQITGRDFFPSQATTDGVICDVD